MNLELLKESISKKLSEEKPETAAMFMKNWRRYKACLEFLEDSGVLKKDSKILDYGCGHPLVAVLLLELGYQVTPYEPFAGEEEFKTARLLGIEELLKTTLPEQEDFDLVLMIDVIEHLSIIKPIMHDVTLRTKRGGALFVSTPNVLRAEMWLSFVLRQTGHPQALTHFLESDNNYSHHQREFTMNELAQTVKHFGFKTIAKACRNTRPDLKDLNALRIRQGLSLKTNKGLFSARKILQRILILLLPHKMNNNLLLLAKKY